MIVAVLGTGAMGAGMARSLRRAGLEVRVWNRTAARAEPLAADAITVAASVGEAVAGADAVLTVLYDAESVFGVADELTAALGSDAVWVQSATIGIDAIRRLKNLLDGSVRLLDAPVLGTRKPAEDGQLVPLVSGPPEIVAQVTPVLDAIGSRTVVAGDEIGQASALKLACNAWVASITAATAQSVALAGALGLDARLFLDAIDGGAVDTPYAHIKGAAMMSGDFTPSFTVDGVIKDLGLIIDAGRGSGLDAGVLDAVRSRFEQASTDGHGGDDMAAVVAAFRRQF